MGTKSETQTSVMDPRIARQTDQLTNFANQLAGSTFDPYTGKRVADMSNLEQQALTGYGALSLPSEFQEVSDIYRGMATRTPQERQADIDAYTQQYTSNVIDPTIAALNRQRAQQVVGEEADIIQGNAFGSGRRGVYEGERQGAFEAAMGQTLGGLQAQGYQQAVNRANLEDQMKMGAAQALGGQAGQALQAQMNLLGGQMQAGALPRTLEQADLDFLYQEALREYEDPFKKFGVLQGTQQVMPQGYGTTTTTTRDPMGQAGGLLEGFGALGQGLGAMGKVSGAAGAAGAAGAGAAGGAGGLATILSLFSDVRLKKNVTPYAELRGVKFYKWEWNEAANEKGLYGPDIGVLAHEIEETRPHLVSASDDGYKKVNYGQLYAEIS